MNTLFRRAPIGAAILLAAANAIAGSASVSFVHPEKYADLPFSRWERDRVLEDLSAHFSRLAAKLPSAQTLKVEVTDIDLAGEMRMRRGGDVRVLNGMADWPRITLRYTLTEGSQVVKQGEAKLTDMAYLNEANRYSSGETLRYEKKMLDDWFKTEVATTTVAQH